MAAHTRTDSQLRGKRQALCTLSFLQPLNGALFAGHNFDCFKLFVIAEIIGDVQFYILSFHLTSFFPFLFCFLFCFFETGFLFVVLAVLELDL